LGLRQEAVPVNEAAGLKVPAAAAIGTFARARRFLWVQAEV